MFSIVLCVLLAAVSTASASSRTCYGSITRLKPTGQKGRGPAESNRDVEHDLPYLQRQRNCYQDAADRNCIQASVIAAIASRESRGGSLLQKTNGYGDRGRAYGIMQCDLTSSSLKSECTKYRWDSCEHINMMVSKVLVPSIKQVLRKHPDWTIDQALQGGVAAYNFGPGNVRTWKGLDKGTKGDNYSNDVIARAQWLYDRGWN